MVRPGSSGEQFVSVLWSRRRSIAARRPDAGRRRRPGRAWGIEPLECRVVPAVITVLNANDSGTGSLRAAIDQADLDPAQDTIAFAPSVTGTIALSSALPDLSTDITINGPGASALAVARSTAAATPAFRIFTVTAGVTVKISGLTMTGGQANLGGGIDNSGTLTVTDSTLSGNSAIGGGGIFNEGAGTLTVTGSTLSGNAATNGSGGGIENSSVGSILNGFIGGTVTIADSTLGDNSAGAGGGIDNEGTGTLTITDSTLSGNSATSNGGGINNGGTVTVINSTLGGNSTSGNGGGIFNSGALTVTNSTLGGNSASGDGGGIMNSFGTVTVTASTLGGNSAAAGGGIDNTLRGKLTATTSLFASAAGGNLASDPGAAFVSLGHNLFSDTPGVALDPTDLTDTDPLLGPLADNGGPTPTRALLPGSPAIHAGAAVAGVATDQRGVPRPQGAAPDIGAFELDRADHPFVQLIPNNDTALVGTANTLTATVFDTDLRPLACVPVTFLVTAGPNAGAQGATDPANGRTDAGGHVRFSYAGTGGIGADTLVAAATLPGGTTVDSPPATTLWGSLNVTNTGDSGPGSLRLAIDVANQHPGPDTITFAPSVAGTVALSSVLPVLSTDITINGPGASALALARSTAAGTPAFRIFDVTAGATVTIAGLTIAGGRADGVSGGGIDNAGTLTVTDSTLSGNTAAVGGGINNSGTLTITDSTLGGNTANGFSDFFSSESTGAGGGIENTGTLTVTDSTVSGNTANGGFPNPRGGSRAAGIGGGIDNSGTLTVTGSIISGNSSNLTGGGIGNNGTATVTNSTLSDNKAANDGGGIVIFAGTLTVTHSTLSGNSAANDGGGILNDGTLTVIASTVRGNAAALGGGIDNAGTLTVTDSTLSGNAAATGGGISNSNGGTLTVTDSTLSGNAAGVFPFFAAGGGGIFNNGTLTVTDSTLGGNSAPNGSGGGIDNIGGRLTASTSLFASTAGGNLVNAPGTTFVSLGHNIFSDSLGVVLDSTDLTDSDPLLGPLVDNGGPTFTQALLPGSPAIGAGAAVAGVATDQRGIPRPQGATPDIGAFESRGFTLAVVAGDGQGTPAFAPFPGPLVVRVTSPFGEPVAGGRVTFAAPTAGASAALVGDPATVGADGRAAVTATANALGGTYAVIARATGAPDVPLTLTNLAPTVTPVAPTVLALQRFGFHAQPTTLVLSFSTPLDPTRAQDLGNYRLVATGLHGRAIRLLSARYDPSANAVTLTPARRLPLLGTFRLTVDGTAPLGLTSTAGVLLDGGRVGRPGSDFVAAFGPDALAGSSNAAFNRARYAWAGPGPFGGLEFAAPPGAAPAGPRGLIAATVAARHRAHRHG